MKKVLITIVGRDRPGIVYQVGQVLSALNYNILEISQTTLLGEFAGIFSTKTKKDTDISLLEEKLAADISEAGLGYWVKEINENKNESTVFKGEPHVISLRGPDRQGLVPEFASILAGFEVNIDNLRAVSFDSNTKPNSVMLVFEVTVPQSVHQNALRQALFLKAEELNIEASIQHRKIFEAIHRI